jgi:hypothetical protein
LDYRVGFAAIVCMLLFGIGCPAEVVTLDDDSPEPGPTVIEGTVADTTGALVDGVLVSALLSGTSVASDTTEGGGAFSMEVTNAGAYAVTATGKTGLIAFTGLDSIDAVEGATGTVDLSARDMHALALVAPLGDLDATAGSTVTLPALDWQVWSREGCPGCSHSIVVGLDGTPEATLPVSVPGLYPGASDSEAFQLTAPSTPGTYTIWATRYATGTEDALDLYTERFPSSTRIDTEFLEIGTLTTEVVPATRTLFAAIPDPVEIRFNAAGDLFVANSGITSGTSGSASPVRVLTPPSTAYADFGDDIVDPDALIVDPTGSVATQAGAVLVGGGYAFGVNDSSHVTEIAPDGSTTAPLIETSGDTLSNPSSFAFLSPDTLLISNYGSNSLSVLFRDGGGQLRLEAFYAANDTTEGMISVEVLDGAVYAVTGTGRLAKVDLNGTELSADLWPAVFSGKPAKIAADVFGDFGDRLLIATDDGLLMAMDTGTGEFERIGAFVFSNPVFGMAVSPVDGVLYVAESVAGEIWKVELTP